MPEPASAPADPVRSSALVFNRPVESLAVLALAGLIAAGGALSLVLGFAGIDAVGHALFGKAVSTTISAPIATIASLVVLLGVWQREDWGWFSGCVVFGAGTLYFAVRLGRAEVAAAGAAAAVALILLAFNRLSGRYG
jgi:hypothetical protein